MPLHPHCLNCDTALHGAYCHACGQHDIDPNLPVSDVVGAAAADVWSLDGRLWRTLARLWTQPGRLTTAFNRGRRTAYVPPFRMFLLIGLAFFLLLRFSPQPRHLDTVALRVSDRLEAFNQRMERQHEAGTAPRPMERLRRYMETQKNKLRDDPVYRRTVQEKLLKRFYNATFLLMPFYALILWLLFRRATPFFTHHLVFSLHVHAFAFSLFTAQRLLQPLPLPLWLSAIVDLVVKLLILRYVYVALRHVYGNSPVRTTVKAAASLMLYGVVFLPTFLLLALQVMGAL